eukprot:SAG11_NODE_334_length_10569_cov_9.662082_5_plen_62_part_00
MLMQVGLSVLKVASGVGRLSGLPIPTLDDVKDQVSDVIGAQTAFLDSMLMSVTDSLEVRPL